jgi:hypothetical protein
MDIAHSSTQVTMWRQKYQVDGDTARGIGMASLQTETGCVNT